MVRREGQLQMKLTWRMWVLIVFVSFSLLAIFVSPGPSIPALEKGLSVKYVEQNSSIFNQGLRTGDIIQSVNGQTITNVTDFENAITILSDNQSHKLTIKTNKEEIIGLFNSSITNEITLEKISPTNLKAGLDIQGGAKAVVAAKDHEITSDELDRLIEISQNRLNLYGLTDMKIYPQDVLGKKFMVIEIAGSSKSDLENLINQQGKFEAKIGNNTVFVGGNEDITYVGRSGQDAGIYSCDQASSGYVCEFRFVIYLSEKAAQRQADLTSNLSVNLSSGGRYLSQPLDLLVDNQTLDSLQIGSDLKGQVTTQIQISGSGSGATQQEALDNAKANMKKLQTILITGSLPFKLDIVKLDRISPLLGEQFVKSILIGGSLAILAVSIIIFARYRKIKISLALLLTSFSEIVIILGVASMIKWNLDLPSLAGIIATIGTGVDSQIMILDESRGNQGSLIEKIKKALFIVFTAFATAFVSLIPLTGFLGFMGITAAGGGFLKGFAITSLIGITAGVVITRPAFADIIKHINEHQ
ncbi:Protein-export membrane protein SecD [uncultured archaeon]|nr:Protein-export membrane protein SecD [uncultured archaeon]